MDTRGLTPGSISGSQYAPNVLAHLTGGRSYKLNFSEEGIRRAAQDAQNYYRLAYYPTNTSHDGKFRRIEVKLQRKGATVRTRAGYVAPKEFTAMTESERRDQLLEAILSEKHYRALPLLSKGYVFLPEKDDGIVSVVTEIEGAAIPVRLEDGRYRGSVEIAVQLLTLSGEPKKFINRTINLNLPPSSYEELRRRHFRYTADVKLPPGEYRLRVVARENQTGQLGSAIETITVLVPGNGLQLSDLVLSAGETRQEHSEIGPLQVGAVRLIPSASRRFRLSSEVKMYVQVKPPANTDLNLEVMYQVMKGGESITQSREVIARRGVVNTPVPLIRRLPVEQMAPGQYELIVTVTDRATGQTESRRTQFRIEAP